MTQSTPAQDELAHSDPREADLARVIAEKFERSVEANLREARWWTAEADTESYPESYRAWARAEAARLTADADADAAIAVRARAAFAALTGPTAR